MKTSRIPVIRISLLIILVGVMSFVILTINNDLNIKRYEEEVNIAEGYYHNEQYEEGIRSYIKAIKSKNSDVVNIGIEVAMGYLALEDHDNAISFLRNIYEKTDSEIIKSKLGEAILEKREYEFGNYIDKGNKYFNNKEYDKAIFEYERAKKVNRNSSLSYKGIAESYVRMKEFELAESEITLGYEITKSEDLNKTLDVIDLFMTWSKYEELGEAAKELYLQEKYEEAVLKYRKAITVMPEESRSYMELAEIYIELESIGEIKGLLSKAKVNLDEEMFLKLEEKTGEILSDDKMED